MKRIAAALAAVLLAFATPTSAADKVVTLTLDGRPVDRFGGVALARNGVVYGDVVVLVKSFNGLLTFQGPAVVVTIGPKTARFTPGSRTALINDGALTMRGQTFLVHGDIYVPLETFVTQVAGAKLRVNAARTHADILVNANPVS